MTERPDPRSLRASDSDREQVAERLRIAAGDGRLDFDELDERLEAAYRAKTYAELEPLVADLPGALDRPPPAPSPSASVLREPDRMRVGGHPLDSTAIAIFGGTTRKGRWVVPRRMQSFALCGGVDLDLTEAVLEDREVTINATAIFGGIDIVVPDGVAVRTTGVGIFGGFDGVNDDGGTPGAPLIRVTGMTLFGGVTVKRKRPKRRHQKSQPQQPPSIPPPPAFPPLPGSTP